MSSSGIDIWSPQSTPIRSSLNLLPSPLATLTRKLTQRCRFLSGHYRHDPPRAYDPCTGGRPCYAGRRPAQGAMEPSLAIGTCHRCVAQAYVRHAGAAVGEAQVATDGRASTRGRSWWVGPDAETRCRHGRVVVCHPVSADRGRVHPPALPRRGAGRRRWRRYPVGRRLIDAVILTDSNHRIVICPRGPPGPSLDGHAIIIVQTTSRHVPLRAGIFLARAIQGSLQTKDNTHGRAMCR
jgi:hypothetical protein